MLMELEFQEYYSKLDNLKLVPYYNGVNQNIQDLILILVYYKIYSQELEGQMIQINIKFKLKKCQLSIVEMLYQIIYGYGELIIILLEKLKIHKIQYKMVLQLMEIMSLLMVQLLNIHYKIQLIGMVKTDRFISINLNYHMMLIKIISEIKNIHH